MARLRRSRAIYIALDDETVYRLQDLLRGSIEPFSRSRLCIFDLIRGQRVAIREEQLSFLMSVPSDRWVDQAEVHEAARQGGVELATLTESGCLLTDGESDSEVRARDLDQALDDFLWHPDALFFHRMGRIQADPDTGQFPSLDIEEVVAHSKARAHEFMERHGEPPPAALCVEDGAGTPIPLPAVGEEGELFELLRHRRTVRAFDAGKALETQKLGTLLKYTFGRLGQVELAPGLQLLKKGSPSGGGLHPIEAFPLIRNVEGVAPGLYHYDVVHHLLRPTSATWTETEAEETMQQIGAGQLYMGEAHCVVLLVARFLRNHWKYRRQSRTYSVMLLDAGHLSQTFYLIATRLGLGAFFSAALDVAKVEDMLPFPPEGYGPLGICGCGYIRQDGKVPSEGSLPFERIQGD